MLPLRMAKVAFDVGRGNSREKEEAFVVVMMGLEN
jgi:hypothetical protein